MANNSNSDPERRSGHMGQGANQQGQTAPPRGASLGHRVTLDEDGEPRPEKPDIARARKGIHTDD